MGLFQGIISQLSHLETMAMMTFSVAMKGNSAEMRFSMTFGLTTIPSKMFCIVSRMASAVRNASGNVMRLSVKK